MPFGACYSIPCSTSPIRLLDTERCPVKVSEQEFRRFFLPDSLHWHSLKRLAGGAFVPAANPPQQLNGAIEYQAPSLDPELSSGAPSLTMAANSFATTLQPVRKRKFS